MGYDYINTRTVRHPVLSSIAAAWIELGRLQNDQTQNNPRVALAPKA